MAQPQAEVSCVISCSRHLLPLFLKRLPRPRSFTEAPSLSLTTCSPGPHVIFCPGFPGQLLPVPTSKPLFPPCSSPRPCSSPLYPVSSLVFQLNASGSSSRQCSRTPSSSQFSRSDDLSHFYPMPPSSLPLAQSLLWAVLSRNLLRDEKRKSMNG